MGIQVIHNQNNLFIVRIAFYFISSAQSTDVRVFYLLFPASDSSFTFLFVTGRSVRK